MLAEGYKDLDDSQKTYYAGQIAGTYQAGKFLAVMDQINTEQSAYNTALREGGNVTKALETYHQELTAAMESDPRRFDIALQQLRNSFAELIAVAMPALVQFFGIISALIMKFQSLSPETRKWILLAMLAVAVIGPLVSYRGSLVLLVSTLIRPIIMLGNAFLMLVPKVVAATIAMMGFFMAHPYVLMAAAIAATVIGLIVIFVLFRDEIEAIFETVVKDAMGFVQRIVAAFSGLFTAVGRTVAAGVSAVISIFRTGLTALATFIGGAVRVIYQMLSYLNPFARHSPSLVEEVDAGIDAIVAKYGELSGVSGPLHEAARAMREFKDATAAARGAAEGAEAGRQREEIAKFDPGSLGAYDNLRSSLQGLRDQLPGLSSAIQHQAQVVRDYEAALDSLDMQIDAEEQALRGLEDALSSIGDELSAAKDRLNDYASAPIQGTKAFSDAIFNNEMQIKALRLELLKLEDANPEVEDLTEQFNALNGAIEEVRGREKELRLAGAGGDILGPLQQQVKEMEAARNAMMSGTLEGPTAEMEALRKEIERLEREGERLDLEEALQFDPLRRQIDELVNGMQEIPFDQIVAGIQTEQANIARLTHAYDQQEGAVESQRLKVDQLRQSRDALSKQLDVENAKLDALEATYSQIESAIQAIERELTNWASLAVEAAAAAKAGAEDAARAVGDLEEAYGSGIDGLEGGLAELQALLDQLQAEAKASVDGALRDLEFFMFVMKNRIREWAEFFVEKLEGVADFLWRWAVGPMMMGWQHFVGGIQWMYNSVKFVIDLLIMVFIEFPLRILAALATLPQQLLDIGTTMMGRFLDAVLWFGGMVIGWFTDLPGVIIGAFGDAGAMLVGVGEQIIRGLWWGIGTIWGELWSWFTGIGDVITGVFDTAGNWLVSAGENIVGGLARGIRNAPFDIATELANTIGKAVTEEGHILRDHMERLKAGERHAGGVEGVDPAAFRSRPYGLRSDEYFRILKKGEAVFTPGQMQALGHVAVGGGGQHIEINGNLEFPNIRSGNDAEEFIRNLEALAS
jgi:hypothetical protein